nr:MAG TPA: hypothetical protein [Caudoviricetes sp.]
MLYWDTQKVTNCSGLPNAHRLLVVLVVGVSLPCNAQMLGYGCLLHAFLLAEFFERAHIPPFDVHDVN